MMTTSQQFHTLGNGVCPGFPPVFPEDRTRNIADTGAPLLAKRTLSDRREKLPASQRRIRVLAW